MYVYTHTLDLCTPTKEQFAAADSMLSGPASRSALDLQVFWF